ncbi:MAG: cytochrome c biogenesis protein transmembrane region [uncultured bacterium]|nr:MAG: cytochrome c biogenesis protein transmembrane region [uncultured bacterium]
MRKLILFVNIIIIAIFVTNPSKALAQEVANVYYNEACSDCITYIKEMEPLLNKYGITANLKDYINRPEYRKELSKENKDYQVPIQLQDSLTMFLKTNLVIEGHVPVKIVERILSDYSNLPKHKLIVLYQPEMHSNAKVLTLYVSGNDPEKISVNEDIVNIISGKPLKEDKNYLNRDMLVPLIIGAISNSLHPCAIAVLLLLLTFLYAMKKKKKDIIGMGLAYVLGIFIVYFLIGLGLLKAISLSNEPFFVAKLASLVLIVLGLINIKDYFFPNLPIHLKVPDFTKGAIQNFMEKASVPTAFIVGALVGLCAFPCTGGIYTVIISTLAATRSAQFVFYLLLYNFIFVVPLLLVVIASSNKKLLERVEDMEMKSSRKLHLITGILMVLIGVGVYLWIGAIIYG